MVNQNIFSQFLHSNVHQNFFYFFTLRWSLIYWLDIFLDFFFSKILFRAKRGRRPSPGATEGRRPGVATWVQSARVLGRQKWKQLRNWKNVPFFHFPHKVWGGGWSCMNIWKLHKRTKYNFFRAKRGRRPSSFLLRSGIGLTKMKKKFWRPRRLDDDSIKSDTFFTPWNMR